VASRRVLIYLYVPASLFYYTTMKKKIVICVLIVLFVAIEPVLSAGISQAIPEKGSELLENFQKAFSTGSFDFMESDFSSAFLSAVPIKQMNDVAQVYGEGFRDIQFKEAQASTYIFEVRYEDGSFRELTAVLDSEGKIVGCWLGAAIFSDTHAILGEVRSLPGTVSVLLCKLSESGDEVIFSHNPDTHLAIGSAFKLYVLSELFKQIEEGEIESDDVVLLKEGDLSMPSGILQEWPPGTPITVATLANLMISISDNTATDVLIHLIGRESIEKDLASFGHENPELNTPFLTTQEFFYLKMSPREDVERYLNSNLSEKRGFLNSLYGKPPLWTIGEPTYIDSIEWFASSNELTDLFRKVWAGEVVEDPELIEEMMDCLAINPGILNAKDWGYVGYKGGSEPGVVSLNYLFQTEEGEWFALSFIWNNPEGEASLDKAMSITGSLMSLVSY